MRENRLRMSEVPATRVEQTVQSLVTKIMARHNWAAMNSFPIPLAEQEDQEAEYMRTSVRQEKLQIKLLFPKRIPADEQLFFD